MGAGSKTEQISFEREMRTREPGGGFTSIWTPIGTAWASVKTLSEKEARQQGAVRSVAKYRFTVYASALDELGIKTTDRIVWNGQLFQIRERPSWIGQVDIDLIAE